MARPNNIYQGPAHENRPQVEEAPASVVISPGSIVYPDSSGEFAPLTATLNTQGRKYYIAAENFFAGRDVDDSNPAGETMPAYNPLPRQSYAALIATGQNVTRVDTPLTISSTAGVLEIGTPGTDRIVAYAREIYNNNSGSSQLIRIRPAE